MKQRKVPLRKCVSCGESKPKRELIRVVKNSEGNITLDITGKVNGRGAYICNSIECFNKARKSKRLNKALEAEINSEVYDELIKEIEKNG